MIPRGHVRQSRVAQLWFLLAALGLGISIGTAMPTAALIGLRSVAPKTAELISAYLGGAGIGLVVGGAGLLLGTLLRSVLAMATSQSVSRSTRAEWATSFFCCAVGIVLTAWYFWSYLHPLD